MQKHILLTLCDDTSASYNLRFVHAFFKDINDIKITLIYIAPKYAHWNDGNDQLIPSATTLSELDTIKRSRGTQMLAKAKEWMVNSADWSPDMIETKVIHSRIGTVGEIIQETRDVMYDAVLLCRRGYFWFEELFENSICHQMLWENIDFPIWVCHRPAPVISKRVLLCVDGSMRALRLADHVGYMLKDEEEAMITLFHMQAAHADNTKTEAIIDSARLALVDNGIPTDRVEAKIVTSEHHSKRIIQEAKEGQYGVVAVGRSGGKPSAMEAIFPSSVSVQLLRELENASLWISK